MIKRGERGGGGVDKYAKMNLYQLFFLDSEFRKTSNKQQSCIGFNPASGKVHRLKRHHSNDPLRWDLQECHQQKLVSIYSERHHCMVKEIIYEIPL